MCMTKEQLGSASDEQLLKYLEKGILFQTKYNRTHQYNIDDIREEIFKRMSAYANLQPETA